MSDDPFSRLARRQRSLVRNALEQEVLHEAMAVLTAPYERPEWTTTHALYKYRAQQVVAVLESYRAPLERLWEQDRLAKRST